MTKDWIRVFVLIILFFSPVLLFAQPADRIEGVVTNATDGSQLQGVKVQLLDIPSTGAITDIDGHYLLPVPPGNYTMVFTAIGFDTDTVHAAVQPGVMRLLNISLKSNRKLLETVVVSSGRFDQKLEELTISMEVIKPRLINSRNTTTVETALEQVPGLTIIDNDPQIRGSSGFTFGVGSRVAIVVDGIPLLSGDAGRPEWSYIPVENIEQVEVIKGASSVLYGSGALSGVINIRSAYPRSKPKTIINYSAGAYSLPASPAANWYNGSLPAFTNLNFLHSRIINKNLDLVIGGNFNMDQGYIGPPPPAPNMPKDLREALLINDTIPTYTNRDMLRIRGRLNFNLRYRPQKIKGFDFGINGNGMLNKTNMVFAWLSDSNGLYKGYPGAVFLEEQSIFNLDPFLHYQAANGIKHSLVTRLFHTDNTISNNQSNKGTLYYGEYQAQKGFEQQELNITGGLMGSLSQSYASLYASSGSPDNRITNLSAYVQADKKFFSVLTLSGGFRFEYFRMNRQKAATAPIVRLGANLKMTAGTFLRASFGQGYRFPTITERYISTKAGLFGVFPNPDLQPEKSNNYEIGLKQGFRIGDFMGYIDVAGFYQQYSNTIEYLFGTWEPTVALVGFKFLNTGNSRITGTDISVAAMTPESNKRFGLSLLAGYTYVKPVSLTPGNIYATTKPTQPGGQGEKLSYKNSSIDTTDNILKYRFKHMVKVDAECRIYQLTIGAGYRFYSRMQNIDKTFADIQELTHNASPYLYEIQAVDYWKRHNGFHIVDARIGWQLTAKQKFSVICNNLFNTDYSLRPLKVEAPRNTAIQYVLTF